MKQIYKKIASKQRVLRQFDYLTSTHLPNVHIDEYCAESLNSHFCLIPQRLHSLLVHKLGVKPFHLCPNNQHQKFTINISLLFLRMEKI